MYALHTAVNGKTVNKAPTNTSSLAHMSMSAFADLPSNVFKNDSRAEEFTVLLFIIKSYTKYVTDRHTVREIITVKQ